LGKFRHSPENVVVINTPPSPTILRYNSSSSGNKYSFKSGHAWVKMTAGSTLLYIASYPVVSRHKFLELSVLAPSFRIREFKLLGWL